MHIFCIDIVVLYFIILTFLLQIDISKVRYIYTRIYVCLHNNYRA